MCRTVTVLILNLVQEDLGLGPKKEREETVGEGSSRVDGYLGGLLGSGMRDGTNRAHERWFRRGSLSLSFLGSRPEGSQGVA